MKVWVDGREELEAGRKGMNEGGNGAETHRALVLRIWQPAPIKKKPKKTTHSSKFQLRSPPGSHPPRQQRLYSSFGLSKANMIFCSFIINIWNRRISMEQYSFDSFHNKLMSGWLDTRCRLDRLLSKEVNQTSSAWALQAPSHQEATDDDEKQRAKDCYELRGS